MILDVKVIPGAKRNEFKDDGQTVKIYLTAPAVENKANKALTEFLAEHFSVRKNQVEIIKGLKSRHKTIRILGLLSFVHPIGIIPRKQSEILTTTISLVP